MAKAKERQAAAGVDPVALALAGVLCISAWGAYRVHAAAQSVLDAAADKETYVMFLTDEGMKSDNEALAAKVNAGQAALIAAQSEAVLLMVACGILAAGLAWRTFRPKSGLS